MLLTGFFLWYSTASNVEIELPVPADASTPTVRTSMGTAVYAPEKEALIWKIKSFPGGKVCCLSPGYHILEFSTSIVKLRSKISFICVI